jgi:GMP synthase-like glutamine amidotransferase
LAPVKRPHSTPSKFCIGRLIKRHEHTIDFSVFIPSKNELPDSKNQFGSFISLGSYALATDKDFWIQQLATFLIQQLEYNKKVLGICFSHQLIIQELGGKVEFLYMDKTQIKGPQKITLSEDLPPFKANEGIELIYAQQQRVTKLGKELTCIGSSLFEYEIVKHNNLTFLGLQAHAQASKEFCRKDIGLKDTELITYSQSFGNRLIDEFIGRKINKKHSVALSKRR